MLAADLAKTRPVGAGQAYRPQATASRKVRLGLAIGSLRCRPGSRASYGTHIELFARDRGVQVPAGIGVSRGHSKGAFVDGGRCRYPLSTSDPTGVVAVRSDGSRVLTVGELFAVWGQPLSRYRLASFAGHVAAFVDGRRWPDDPRTIPLSRHAQIELEVGPPVQPHAFYVFPRGL